MNIEFSPQFERAILDILNYIQKNNKQASNNFQNRLFKKLESLAIFPYKFRKSIYYNDEYVRDFIFMGYTIPYLIDEDKKVIIVLDIFKWIEK